MTQLHLVLVPASSLMLAETMAAPGAAAGNTRFSDFTSLPRSAGPNGQRGRTHDVRQACVLAAVDRLGERAIGVMFKSVCPLGSQMVVHADGRSHATALVTLDPEALGQWGRARGMSTTDFASLAADLPVRGYVDSCVEVLNSRLNHWETIKDFRILDRDLTVDDDGELTPSMKVRRKVVESRYERWTPCTTGRRHA